MTGEEAEFIVSQEPDSDTDAWFGWAYGLHDESAWPEFGAESEGESSIELDVEESDTDWEDVRFDTDGVPIVPPVPKSCTSWAEINRYPGEAEQDLFRLIWWIWPTAETHEIETISLALEPAVCEGDVVRVAWNAKRNPEEPYDPPLFTNQVPASWGSISAIDYFHGTALWN